jgi:hypothetical protein
MSAQVQINNIEASGQAIYVSGFIVLSGTYPTGGDPLNFSGSGTLPAIADPSFVGLLPGVESSGLLNLDVWSMAASGFAGANSTAYQTLCTKAGSPAIISPATGVKLQVAALSATPTTQHAAASYESQYTSDIIAFMAVFTKNL